MLKHLNLRYRLIINAILPILLGGVIIYLGTQYVFRNFVNNTLPNLTLLEQIGTASRTLQTEALEYIVTSEAETLEEIYDEDLNALETLLTRAENQQLNNSEVTALIQVATDNADQVNLIVRSHQETLSLMTQFEALDDSATDIFQESDALLAAQPNTTNSLIHSEYHRLLRIILLETAEFVAFGEEDSADELEDTYIDFKAISDQWIAVLERSGQSRELITDYEALTEQAETLTSQIITSHKETLEALEALEDIEGNLQKSLVEAEQSVAQITRQQARATTIWGALITLLTILIALVLSTLLNKRLTQPIATLVETTEAIGKETFAINLPLTNITEIDRLQIAIQKMAMQLQTTMSSLEDQINERTAALEKADLASRAKSQFLANMSHELRTPLNGILGYAQILQRNQELSPLQHDGLNIIKQSGEHLLTLITDILDLSKIEAGKLDLLPYDFNLLETLQGLIGLMYVRAQNKGLYLDLELPDEAITTHLQAVHADEKRLRQVLINLLTNAIKFTNKGTVTLQVAAAEPPEDNQKVADNEQKWIRFTVSDTGIGMQPDEIEKIFEPFEQVGQVLKQNEGTGLGLAITQRLVMMMGGELQVESQYGQGSTFAFTILIPPAKAKFEPQKVKTPEKLIVGYQGNQYTILVVDDKAQNRWVVQHLLEPLGFGIIAAENGEEAIAKAIETQPDLIFMDMMMPVKSGFEATQELRQISDFDQTPIIGLSASVFAEEQQRVHLAGCDAFMPKPFEVNKLLSVIKEFLHIDWVYEDEVIAPSRVVETPTAVSTTTFIIPPEEEMNALRKLAKSRRLRKITEITTQLVEKDPQYQPFVSQLQELVKGYKTKEIIQFLAGSE